MNPLSNWLHKCMRAFRASQGPRECEAQCKDILWGLPFILAVNVETEVLTCPQMHLKRRAF